MLGAGLGYVGVKVAAGRVLQRQRGERGGWQE